MKRGHIIIVALLSFAVLDRGFALLRQEAKFAGKPNDVDMVRELDSYLASAATNDDFSGTVLVAKDGEPVFRKAYGLADKEKADTNNEETKYNLGSVNKIFTAVAIAQLAERGKLSFDDPIAKHLPNYPNKSVANSVTIHQLLTHTSGLGNYQNAEFFAQLDNLKAVVDLLPLFVEEQLSFEPGAKWQYSNSGYVVLGLIVEQVSGQDYYQYVKENIFTVAGMNDTDFYDKKAQVANRAIGYTRMDESGRAQPGATRRDNTSTRPAKGSPAGGGYSTADDLLKFSVALLHHKLISKKFTEIVMTGKIDVGGPIGKYAYGFSDKMLNGRHIVGHNGGAPGIGANLDIFPELGYTAIILTNYDPPAMMPLIMKIRGLLPM